MAPAQRSALLAVLVVVGWVRGALRWALRRSLRAQTAERAAVLVRGTERQAEARRVALGMLTEQSIQWVVSPRFRLLHGTPLLGREHLDEAEAARRGVMLLTAHCGWIQALLWCLADAGRPITCVSGQWIVHQEKSTDVRQMPMVADAIAKGTRHIVAGTGAFAQLDEVVATQGRALMAVDMPGSLAATYLGKPANVGQASFRVPWNHGCPVVPVGIRRRGLRMTVELGAPLWPADHATLEQFAQAGLDAVSASVLPDLQQYMPGNVAILWPGGDAANARPNRIAWAEKTRAGT